MSREGRLSGIQLSREGSVAILTLCRPEKKNTLTPDDLSDMSRFIRRLSNEDTARALILRGKGSSMFSAGFDIAQLPGDGSPESARAVQAASPLEQTLETLASFPYPTIAMLNGDAYGGGFELAVACDLRIAGDHVKIGMPPVKLGLVYPYPGFRRFIKVFGFAVTLEIFLTGRMYDSRTCLLKGLVSDVAASGDLHRVSMELAETMAAHAPMAVKGSKQALHALGDAFELSPEQEALLWRLFSDSLNSKDFKEGRQAFLEKRKPRFCGE